MKRIFAFFVTICILTASLAGCRQKDIASPDSNISGSNTSRSYDGSLGSAGSMKGKTVVVSIFADDNTTKWDKNDADDLSKIDATLGFLKIATHWLTARGENYTDYIEFICDWKQYPDLRYDAGFDKTLVRPDGEMYWVQREYIMDNIDSDRLLEKYGAENIIYLYLFNTDYSNPITPRTFSHGCGPNVDVEYVNLYTGASDYFSPPSSYAHEILHTFGAPDLYYENDTIPQSYVDYCERISSSDIMFSSYLGISIKNKFTELDAYYVGLTDNSATVEKWNLGLSEHEIYGDMVQ